MTDAERIKQLEDQVKRLKAEVVRLSAKSKFYCGTCKDTGKIGDRNALPCPTCRGRWRPRIGVR